MKTTRNALFALLLLTAGTVTAASAQISVSAGIHIGSSGRASVDLGFFYDNLASYGNWIQRPSYGWVWTPASVSSGWRPYEDGHWVWTDQGWTWITDEPYGWATYHYGRWYDDPEIGWAWVPGDEWGPAWVSWQEGADYVGWAPLPPGYDPYGGYGSYDYGIGPEDYVFVPERNFLSVSISSYIVPSTRVRSFWGQTRNYTSYRREGDRIYNQGIPVDRVQRYVGRSVTRYQIADLGADAARQRTARIAGNQVQIFRPQVQRSVQVAPPVQRPAARRAVVSAEQFQARNPSRAQRRQQVSRDQQVGGAQPGRQVQQPYQPRTRQQDQYQGNRQRQVNPDNAQQYQGNRQRQVNPQRYQPPQQDNQPQRPPRAVNPQQQGQRPPQANRQQQPPPQSQGNHNGQVRRQQQDDDQQKGNGNGNGRQRNQNRERNRDRNQNQDQDDQNRRPPVR